MQKNIDFPKKKTAKKVWPIGGGKGGVGKSLITANLGLAIASQLYEQNKEVLLLDADLGSGNLHNFLGIKKRKFTLNDFLTKQKKTLKEIIIDSPLENLKLISGGIEILNLANPNYQQKVRLLQSIKQINADYILLDLAPSSHYNTIDFFSLSNNGIIVTTPEPPAIHSSYGFLKNTVYRKLNRCFKRNSLIMQIFSSIVKSNGQYNISKVSQLIEKMKDINADLTEKANQILSAFHPQLILNMVENYQDLSVVERFQKVVKKYLNIDIEYLGYIPFDKKVRKSSRILRPIIIEHPNSRASRCLYKIAERLLDRQFRPMSF